VSLLDEEAGSIFGLDSEFVVLLLSSMRPQILDKSKTIAGLPHVFPNASLFVFFVGPCQPVRHAPSPMGSGYADHRTHPQFQHHVGITSVLY
jgi:hypothetical protein